VHLGQPVVVAARVGGGEPTVGGVGGGLLAAAHRGRGRARMAAQDLKVGAGGGCWHTGEESRWRVMWGRTYSRRRQDQQHPPDQQHLPDRQHLPDQ
jgi:hypothetical protein